MTQDLRPSIPERRVTGDDKLAREWTLDMSTEDEVKFRKELADAAVVLNVLKNILRKRYESASTVRAPDPSNVNWSLNMAYKHGQAAELADLYRLLP